MDALKRHALDNVWCEPDQDKQNIFQIDRLTPERGALNKAPVIWNSVQLPKQSTTNRYFYHLYQIGKLSNIVLNIKMDIGKWYSATEICNLNKEVVDVYFENGCLIPRDNVYLMMLSNDNFIMAIEISYDLSFGQEETYDHETGAMVVRNITLDNHNPIIRFYNNGRFYTPEYLTSNANVDVPITAYGVKILTMQDYNAVINKKAQVKTQMRNVGSLLYWADGYLINEPTIYNMEYIGQHHYFIWDSSIKFIDWVPVKDLVTFTSVLDLNVPKLACLLNTRYDTIDYNDDIDFYLVKRDGSKYKGVIVPRILPSSVRQLTHNAYSIRADIINSLSNSHEFLNDLNSCHIVAVVRQGGFKRGLVHQSNRIKELYRLPRAEILQAMGGVNSLVPEWQAVNLELSDYATIMRSRVNNINSAMLNSAYGYNAVNLYMEQSSYDVTTGSSPKYFTVAPGLSVVDTNLTGRRAVFCYDYDGYLFHKYMDYDSTKFLMIPQTIASNTNGAEIYRGEIASTDGVIYTKDIFASPDLKYWGFRVYGVPVDGTNTPLGGWSDITDSRFYTYHPNGYLNDPTPTIVWNTTLLSQFSIYPAIKLNKYVHCQEFQVNSRDEYLGYHYVTINTEKSFDGADRTSLPDIPPGQVDVFLNGRSLIEGIDYCIKWPSIYIWRISDTRNSPLGDRIFVRMRGFCDKDTMKIINFRDTGFLQASIASVNDTFNIRNDRNSRIVIGGKTFSKTKVSFAEDLLNVPGITDGLPYGVSDQWGATEYHTGINSLDMRTLSLDIDSRVEQYLTPRIRAEEPEHNFIINERWEIVSPFLAAIINDITHFNVLSDPTEYKRGAFDKATVEAALANYMHLLEVDPCILSINPDYILYLPHQYSHTLTVTQDQYALLQYVIGEYLNNLVDLTPYLTIG